VLSTPLLLVQRRDKRLSPLQTRLADTIVEQLGDGREARTRSRAQA
jgi:hypothetical protein